MVFVKMLNSPFFFLRGRRRF